MTSKYVKNKQVMAKKCYNFFSMMTQMMNRYYLLVIRGLRMVESKDEEETTKHKTC